MPKLIYLKKGTLTIPPHPSIKHTFQKVMLLMSEESRALHNHTSVKLKGVDGFLECLNLMLVIIAGSMSM